MPLAYNLPESFSDNLVQCVDWSRRQMDPFLKKRLEQLRQIVGKHYGRGGCTERIPQPLTRLYCSILSRYLVARSPSALIEGTDPRYRSLIRSTKLWAKQFFSHINLERILQRWAYEALIYPVAFVKVCEQYGDNSGQGEISAPDDMKGPWVYNVDPERTVFDMAATDWCYLDYIGHRCTVDQDELWGEGVDEDAVRKLVPDPHSLQNEHGLEKTEGLSLTDADWGRKLRKYIDFWELYLPKENLLVWYPVNGNTIDRRPICVKEYRGPRGRDFPTGPFMPLIYEEVPGNLMGNPVVHAIYDLHAATNRMTRKLLRQAERQKNLDLFPITHKEEGDRVKNANDGDTVGVTDPRVFNTLRTGGPDQATFAFNLNVKQLADYYGGNISIMGGLGAQSPTATQDQMLSGAASQQLQFLQQTMISATRPVMKAMIWHKWFGKGDMEYTESDGVGGSFPWAIQEPSRTELGFEQMQISVHPYSMQPVTPQLRIAQLKRLMLEEVVPLLPALMQQGVTIDFAAYFRHRTELEELGPYTDEILALQPLPEEMYQSMIEQGGGQQGGMQQPRIRPEGTGEYTRTNVGIQNPDQMAMQAMTGADFGGSQE